MCGSKENIEGSASLSAYEQVLAMSLERYTKKQSWKQAIHWFT